MAETQGNEPTKTVTAPEPELTETEKLDNGVAALTNIDADLFSGEIKAINARVQTLETKEEVKSWLEKHKQDIVNAVMIAAITYIVFRLTA